MLTTWWYKNIVSRWLLNAFKTPLCKPKIKQKMYGISDGGVKKGLRISPTILPGATVGLVGLAAQGSDIPFLRQIIGLVCLISLSCVFVLGVLKGHDIGLVRRQG